MATLKEGVMYKRGKINTDWKLRTFVLTAKQLAYFKGGSRSPSGTIELQHIHQVSNVQDNEFMVVTSVRTFALRGESLTEAQTWRNAIVNACNKAGITLLT
ncbi:pleckstrin homology domain-containing family A member 1-like [Dysidea avara]|uniref:pleckstrin homology domain-containing family A member 1-like n=1 Tax=Dysidea avara TaxID=196820 RepID=UPI0033343A2B